MPQKSPDENRRLAVVNVQPHQTVRTVRELWFEEILIVREQRRIFQPMQQRNDVRVLNARSGEFTAQSLKLHPPLAQAVVLVVPDVFIQQIHAANWPLSDRASRPRASSNAPRARRIVFRIAALLTRLF